MTSNPTPPRGEPRREYQTPHLTRVRLVPDEAVLASCKNNATHGPFGFSSKCSFFIFTCSTSAS